TRLLFAEGNSAAKDKRPEPDWAAVHLELKRKHVTKQLIWEEYKVAQPGGYQYSAFCLHYAAWAVRLQLSMRQEHRVGENLCIDHSRSAIDLTDPLTGEVKVAKLFVAVLGASSYTYVEPELHEDLPTWVQCHINALNFFEGVTALWVPANPKVGVT